MRLSHENAVTENGRGSHFLLTEQISPDNASDRDLMIDDVIKARATFSSLFQFTECAF